MPRPKETEREQIQSKTRELLLQAAAREFAREGYDAANINRISQAAGFAKGTIYNYFPSKHALLLALIEETAESQIDFIIGQVRQEEHPVRRLERFYQAGFDWVTHNLTRGMVMIITLYGPHAEFKQDLYQAYQPMFEFVANEIIAPGITRGIFQPVDPVSTAGLLMTIYMGAASQVDEGGRFYLDPGQVTAILLDGLRQKD